MVSALPGAVAFRFPSGPRFVRATLEIISGAVDCVDARFGWLTPIVVAPGVDNEVSEVMPVELGPERFLQLLRLPRQRPVVLPGEGVVGDEVR